jgi:hypothetical protein
MPEMKKINPINEPKAGILNQYLLDNKRYIPAIAGAPTSKKVELKRRSE